jgi:hypothetical protein
VRIRWTLVEASNGAPGSHTTAGTVSVDPTCREGVAGVRPGTDSTSAWQVVVRPARLLIGNLAECRGTLSWVAIVTATRLVLRGADPRLQHRLLQSASTNLNHLAHDPLNVLLTSVCFVTSTSGYFSFLLGALVISAPVERWLGLRRWLITVALGHIGATLVVAFGLKLGVSAGWIDPAVSRAIDVGISYAMRSLAATLFFVTSNRRLRRLHLSVLLVVTLVPLFVSHTFTDAGHLTALCLGLLTGAFFRRRRLPLRLADLERPLVVAPGSYRSKADSTLLSEALSTSELVGEPSDDVRRSRDETPAELPSATAALGGSAAKAPPPRRS